MFLRVGAKEVGFSKCETEVEKEVREEYEDLRVIRTDHGGQQKKTLLDGLRVWGRPVLRPRRPPPTIYGGRRRLLLIGAPPPPIICRRAADAIFPVLFNLLKFSMTKKGHQKMLRIERNFSRIFDTIN